MKYEAKHEIKNEEPRILRLFPAENHDGISSSIKLSWRVSDNVATFLSNTNTNPYLLLISARRVGNRMVERGRRVVPLSDGSVYPEFFGPGDYTVIPIIVSEKPSLYGDSSSGASNRRKSGTNLPRRHYRSTRCGNVPETCPQYGSPGYSH